MRKMIYTVAVLVLLAGVLAVYFGQGGVSVPKKDIGMANTVKTDSTQSRRPTRSMSSQRESELSKKKHVAPKEIDPAASRLPEENTPFREAYEELKNYADKGNAYASRRLYQDAMRCENYLNAKDAASRHLGASTDVANGSVAASASELGSYSDAMSVISRTLEANQELCEDVDRKFLRSVAYKLVLGAATAGDSNAQSCYVSAQFIPNQSESIDHALINEYRHHALKFATDGLKNGDWQMVSWLARAYSGLDQNAFLKYLAPENQIQYYAYTKLQRLGADESSAKDLDQFLQAILDMNNFSVSQVQGADKWAQSMYNRYFIGKPPYDENATVCSHQSYR
ncbi:MAG: hypothetical protein WBW92_00995 [Rhodanobacteraceae bacterium]